MFKNKELRVSLAKKGKTTDNEEFETEGIDQETFEERVDYVHKVTKDIVRTFFGGVFIYVVLDTGRKVLVERAIKIP